MREQLRTSVKKLCENSDCLLCNCSGHVLRLCKSLLWLVGDIGLGLLGKSVGSFLGNILYRDKQNRTYLDSSSSNESLKSLFLASIGGLEFGLLEPGDDEGDQILADFVHGLFGL